MKTNERNELEELKADRDRWRFDFFKLAKQLDCLASFCRDSNEHVFEKADTVMRHWKQSVELSKKKST